MSIHRVVFQASDERNYHIFYQLCARKDEMPELQLSDPEDFIYLNHGECTEINGVDDEREFSSTQEALRTLGKWRWAAVVRDIGYNG